VRRPVTRPPLGHVRSTRRHRSPRFHTEGERRRCLVLSATKVNVDVVEPGGVDLDDRLTRLRGGLRRVFVAPRFLTAGVMYAHGFHGTPPEVTFLKQPSRVEDCRRAGGLYDAKVATKTVPHWGELGGVVDSPQRPVTDFPQRPIKPLP